MENLYQQALFSFQQNDFEKAIEYLRQCEPSSQVDMLYRECIKGAKSQYSYIINEAQRTNDNLTLNEYVHKYVNVVGQDDYILQFVSSEVGGNVDESSGLAKMDQWLSGTIDAFLFPNIKKILVVGFVLSVISGIINQIYGNYAIADLLGEGIYFAYSLFIALVSVVTGFSLAYFIVRSSRMTLNLQSICYGCLLINTTLILYLWYYTNLHEFGYGEQSYYFHIGAFNNILALSPMLVAYIKGQNMVSKKWVIPFIVLYHFIGLFIDLCVIMEFDVSSVFVYIGLFTLLLDFACLFMSIYKANDIISAYEGCKSQSDMLADDAKPWYNQDVAGVSLKNILIIIVVLAVVVGGIMYLSGNHNKVEQAPAEDTVTIAYDESVSADGTTGTIYDTSQQTDYVEDEVEDAYEEESTQNYTQFDFRGTVNDKYEIAGTLRVDNEGRIYGRYCYISTLNKYGDHPNTWITLNGNVDNSGDATIRGTYYKNASEEEYWRGHLQHYDGQYTFSGQFENNDGTVLSMYLRSI